MISVFISHSGKDRGVVEQLITLLQSALRLPAEEIRATSVDGFRLPGGANTDEALRAEVNDSRILIGLISQASIKSTYVIFELGARWGSGKPMVPLLAPDLDPELLDGPLRGINALSCKSRGQLHQLVTEVARSLGIVPEPAAVFQKWIDEIVVNVGERTAPGNSNVIAHSTGKVETRTSLQQAHLAVVEVFARAAREYLYPANVASALGWNRVKAEHALDELSMAGYLNISDGDHGAKYSLSRRGRTAAVDAGFTE